MRLVDYVLWIAVGAVWMAVLLDKLGMIKWD